jgi:hypothetical protein
LAGAGREVLSLLWAHAPGTFLRHPAGAGWDQGNETLNLETSYTGRSHEAVVTVSQGRAFEPGSERALIGRYGYFFGGSYKVGASVYQGWRPGESRTYFGPYGTLGFTPSFFLSWELDAISRRAASNTLGGAYLTKLTYEPWQGWQVFWLEEGAAGDFSTAATTRFFSHGIGVQLFPRPHWEAFLLYQKRLEARTSSDYEDFLALVGHFYL